eukprot:4975375-Lingulodinium_polyedra.AAC.1
MADLEDVTLALEALGDALLEAPENGGVVQPRVDLCPFLLENGQEVQGVGHALGDRLLED